MAILKFRHIVGVEEDVSFLLGNATLGGQIFLGAYGLAEGSCAIVDGFGTPNPLAKTFYLTGGALQVTSSVCFLGASVASLICPAAIPVMWGVGYATRKVGNRLVDGANVANPAPALTKVI